MNAAVRVRDLIGPPIHGLVHWALFLALLPLGLALSSGLRENDRASCEFGNSAYLPDPLFMVVAVVGLICGRFLSHLRPASAYHDRSRSGPAWVGPLALVFAAAALVVIWGYEAVGTAHVTVPGSTHQFEPITFYVRCAIYHDKAATGFGLWTMVTTLLASFMVGHWLWSDHPDMLGATSRAARARSR